LAKLALKNLLLTNLDLFPACIDQVIMFSSFDCCAMCSTSQVEYILLSDKLDKYQPLSTRI